MGKAQKKANYLILKKIRESGLYDLPPILKRKLKEKNVRENKS